MVDKTKPKTIKIEKIKNNSPPSKEQSHDCSLRDAVDEDCTLAKASSRSQILNLHNKFILDACCGARQMWFNKKHPNVIYQDIRQESKGFSKWQPTLEIKPDVIGDFKKMDYPDKSFKLVVADPPHFVSKKLSGAMQLKYGGLHPETWQSDLKKAFKEMWRVLDDYGVLIIKWNDYHIKFKDMLKQTPFEPLFGNISTSGRNSTTKWFCFMKIPESEEQLIATPLNSKGSPSENSLNMGYVQ